MTGWQAIETAPKDGTRIILGAPACEHQGEPIPPRVTEGYWLHAEPYIRERRDLDGRYIDQDESDGYDGWMSADGGFSEEHPPTHWMPLPPPPLSEERSGTQADRYREALERIADPRNIHFAGDAQVVARDALGVKVTDESLPEPERRAALAAALMRFAGYDKHSARVIAGTLLGAAPVVGAATETCFCDERGIGEPGVSCGDCPIRDYKRTDGVKGGAE